MSGTARSTPLPVVVLAAGGGRRLAPRTDDRPKCMLEVGGRTLIARLLADLGRRDEAGDVHVVTGHASAVLDRHLDALAHPRAIHRIPNPRWDVTNNVVSAWLARGVGRDGFVLANSDVLAHADLVDTVLRGPDETALVVDETRPIRDEAMKVEIADGRLVAIAKTLDPDQAAGEYVGLARFDAAGARAFFHHVDQMVEAGEVDDWYEAAIGAAATDVAIRTRSTEGLPWIEIDDADDLVRAEREIGPAIDGAAMPPSA